MMTQIYSANQQHFKYQPSHVQKHCLFLHGWDAEQNVPFLKLGIPPIQQLKPFENFLKPTLRQYRWIPNRIVYPSQLPFPEAAHKVILYLEELARKHRLNFQNTVIIGYSTGGLVARAMCAYFNFPCSRLITLATPHLGIRDIAQPFAGVPSIAAMLPNSDALNLINLNNRDRIMRARHDYFGVTFKGHGNQNHNNDGLVDLNSATAYGLQNVQNRFQIHIPKREHGFFNLVHNSEALQPKHVLPFLYQCKHILKQY